MTSDTSPGANLSDLSPGIARTVLWLRDVGFNTTDSGDGSNAAAGMECALPFANVSMLVDPLLMRVESHRLLELVRGRGVLVDPVPMEEALLEGSPSIQVTYDPISDIAILSLFGVTDAMLQL